MVKRNTDRGKGQRRMDNRDQKKTTRQKLISSISVGQISHRKWVSFSLPHRSPFLFTFSCYFHHSHLSISFAQMNGSTGNKKPSWYLPVVLLSFMKKNSQSRCHWVHWFLPELWGAEGPAIFPAAACHPPPREAPCDALLTSKKLGLIYHVWWCLCRVSQRVPGDVPESIPTPLQRTRTMVAVAGSSSQRYANITKQRSSLHSAELLKDPVVSPSRVL